MKHSSIRAALGWLIAALLAACTGGSQTAGIDRGGVRTPVAIQGPITGFGSIVVHGVHYDIAQADVTVNDEHASGGDLAIGQVVTIVGERDDNAGTGVASTVEFQANVRGPISELAPAATELTVLGQRIETHADTAFDLGAAAPAFASLTVGEVVEVSGFVGSGGAIVATRVAAAPAGSTWRVFGTVSDENAAAKRFAINDLAVDYSTAASLEDFATGQPSNGDAVVVIGSTLGASGELVASVVRRKVARLESEPGGEGEIEGLITRFVSPTDFDVAGTPVAASSTTVYEGGTAADLRLDLKVQVAGTVDAAGTLAARQIEIAGSGFDDDRIDN